MVEFDTVFGSVKMDRPKVVDVYPDVLCLDGSSISGRTVKDDGEVQVHYQHHCVAVPRSHIELAGLDYDKVARKCRAAVRK